MWIRSQLAILSLALAGLGPSPSSLAEEGIDYTSQIKPLLRDRCYACHGALKQEAGLRLDTAALMKSGGDSGSAISVAEPAASLLVERVAASDADYRMPPEHEGEPFSSEQIDTLLQWIEQGGVAPLDETPESAPELHWSFQPVVRPPVPVLPESTWGKNPIDAFLAERHAQQRLDPQPEAPRLALVRRLYIDLIGLPPSPEELQLLEDDLGPDWYERLVERLLNDPRHGERWGRHWMDVWRYSDWWGLGKQLRNSQEHIWHWRDWIIESLNEDLPYDEMVRRMLAADELFPTDPQQLRASGFLARNFFLFNRSQWMDETVEHVSKGFLGLTMNCAKCHDHKYDPLTQLDYYKFRAFFEPYLVRMDLVPGEADLSRDGIPRAFDGWLDVPTYRFVRGEETNPDKSTSIAPDVPEFFTFKPLAIEPVDLPREAWQPARLPWVRETHLAAANEKVRSAATALAAAREKQRQADRELQMLLEGETPDATQAVPPNPIVQGGSDSLAETTLHDDFAAPDPTKWKQFGGQWKYSAGRLEQLKDEARTAYLRFLLPVPRDFDAKFRFTILGGDPYRSVGLSFDASQQDPLAPAVSEDSEQSVYLSAQAQGSKVQVAFRQGGQWQYPAEARQERAIELEREYMLHVQVRGSLINVAVDGEPALAWRSPLPRRDGALQLTTFTARAAFHEITVEPLGADVELRDPEQERVQVAAATAQGELVLAEAAVKLAEAELEFVRRCSDALRLDSPEGVAADLNAQAVRAERQVAVARARHEVALAELALLNPQGDHESLSKKVAATRAQLTEAVAKSEAVVEATDSFTPPVGAKWMPTRFKLSTTDDPLVEFPSTSTGRRSALADWITDRRNPLTARVAVNHLWTRHMGVSLVPTEFDFGRKNADPKYTQLVDWMAAELMDHGWSMKHLHRLIVNSAAYRMSSSLAGAEANVAIDPDNQFWWRRWPTRLESQVVRDSLLAHAGTLSAVQGGPSVMPADQAASTRRSLYFFHSNNERNLFLSSFDEARVQECYRREQSIVPQQALALSNSQLVLEAAEQIANRLTKLADEDRHFIMQGFRVLLAMDAGEEEIAASLDALQAWRELPGATPASARAQLIWALLNHNDYVTLR